MSSDNREMIGYEEISNDPKLQEAAAELLRRFPDGTVSDLLNVFFSNKEGVPKDVFDYFCMSDFFPLFVEDAAEIVRKLIDFNAERGWYELIADVCRNQKSVALYCKEIYHCFTQHYGVYETRILYEASEKPGDMSSARRKNKQDSKSMTINKKKEDRSQKQQPVNPDFSAYYEKLNKNYMDLNNSFQNLNKEYHDFGAYLALLMQDNQKIRTAHLDCQRELNVEKAKNAVLEARIKEQESMAAELKTLLQQLKEKEDPEELLESRFPTNKIELMIEKSDQIMDMITQLSAAQSAQSLEYTERMDLEEDLIMNEDLNLMPDLTEEELYALQPEIELSTSEQLETETEFQSDDLSDYEPEFGIPDEETLNAINGNSSDVETILFDPDEPEADAQAENIFSMDNDAEEFLSHGIPDAEGDEPTISLDLSEQIKIKDHYQDVKKKASVFTSLVRNFEKRKFEKKNFTEQKNLLFKKMREYSFEADRIGIVRQIIDAGGSLPNLYTLVEKNPDLDALNGYLAMMKKDMTRVVGA